MHSTAVVSSSSDGCCPFKWWAAHKQNSLILCTFFFPKWYTYVHNMPIRVQVKIACPVVDTIIFFEHTHSSSSPELYYFWSGWHNLCTNGQALHNCTSSYCPVHKWLHKLHNGVLHNSDLSQLGGTQAIVPLHAFSPAAPPVFCTRGGGAPPGQIPRFTFHGQFVTISLKEQFPVVFWGSSYFDFAAYC